MTLFERHSATRDPLWVKWGLIGLGVGFFILFLILPLLTVFSAAFARGWVGYWEAIREPATLHSIGLTLLATSIAVPLGVLFGIAAAWSITRFDFFGKTLLISLIDLPFSVSPVVVGLIFTLTFSVNSLLGGWLDGHGIKVIFALPGIVLVTLFVTFPMVARELIPLLEAQGREEEEAAVVLGARGWQVLRHITLPNVKWGLIYGVILCNARAMGEFGAVSVVTAHVYGQTNTMPLQVEALYNEYRTEAAFAVASLLALLALATLGVRLLVEHVEHRQAQRHGA